MEPRVHPVTGGRAYPASQRFVRDWPAIFAVAFLSACTSDTTPLGSPPPVTVGGECSIPTDQIFDGGVGRDGIPALTNPEFISVWDQRADYLRDGDRVIKVELDGAVYAIPHNILWRHEIVNMDRGSEQVAVTYCPLTGSSMVFDRTVVGGAEFGVSGLLFQNNLIMYDRNTNQSLWPQMMRESRCGERDGQTLTMVQGVEMEWLQLRRLHADAVVIPALTEDPVLYQIDPYGDYDDIDNQRTLFPQELVDQRRQPKERVLGIPNGVGGGKAYPFLTMQEEGQFLAVNDVVSGLRVVVLWDHVGKAAYAYQPTVNGQELTIEASETPEGTHIFTDLETGSVWGWDGRAFQGSLAGEQMEPVRNAFVAFWFAWAAFHPQTDLFGRPIDEVS